MRSPASSDDMSLTASHWENRYQEGSTPWDLEQAAPPFQHLMATSDAPAPGKAIVLGCGRGYDALLFARHGFEVTGVDYAPSAIAAAAQSATEQGLPLQLLQQDIFDLLPEYATQFDYVVEHTCFCALVPELRDRYVDLVYQLLKPGGKLLGLFFTHNRPGGPPYGSTPTEIRERFSHKLQLNSLELSTYSVPSRVGEEHLGIFQKVG